MNGPQEYLANERTFLAWLRTCVAIIGLGFVVARFGLFLQEFGITVKNGTLTNISTHYASSSLGVALVLVGMGRAIYALKNYLHTNQAIESGTYIPKNSHLFCCYRFSDFRSRNSCLFDFSGIIVPFIDSNKAVAKCKLTSRGILSALSTSYWRNFS
jgi:putative membrane protein